MNYEQFNHGEKKIFLVDMKKEQNHIFSEIAEKGIKKYLKQGKNIGIIVNKKGYSSGIICHDCGYIPKCTNCDIPISTHKDNTGLTYGICHICKKTYNIGAECSNCQGINLNQYGIGTQKISEIIKKDFNIEALIIESETVNSLAKIERIEQKFNNSQIIIGTSLLSKPIKNHKFDLIVFLNADIGLNIPDFNSNYRNFIFLYETFQNHKTENFIVQSYNTENYSIKNSCEMDFEKFKKIELKYRKSFGYPPYNDLCVLLYKNETEEKLFNKINQIYSEIIYLKEKYELNDIEIYSTPPLVYKIFGKYRYNIILKGKNLRNFMDIIYSKLKINEKGFKVDWEPDSLI